jgi:hypothetical protein
MTTKPDFNDPEYWQLRAEEARELAEKVDALEDVQALRGKIRTT